MRVWNEEGEVRSEKCSHAVRCQRVKCGKGEDIVR